MGQFEGRRFSWARLTVLVVALVAVTFTSLSGWRWFQDVRAAEGAGSWFGGYADVTVTPRFGFESPESPAGRQVVLSFVVADQESGCEPSWGAAYSLDEAATDLDLDRRVARLQQRGGTAVVSFGGAANTELAVSCTDEDDLVRAYRDVVERYDLTTIDLDVEGPALSDQAANERRARALRRLQQSEDVQVWLTLPVAPDGLTEEGLAVVRSTLEADVDLAGVNGMTMNYGGSRAEGVSMAEASIAALESTHEQLQALYRETGEPIGSAAAWRRIGATPMIGQNDVAGEVFTLDDAVELHEFAVGRRIGRMSMWSLNRDRGCGANYPDVAIVSDACSGVPQDVASFATVLAGDFEGRVEVETEDEPAEPAPAAVPVDDPETSPYPVWTEDGAYQADTRVVWRRNVYVAMWWSQGEVPDAPVADAASSPWRLVGPVLPGETPAPPPTLPDGTYPDWDEQDVYRQGDRVQIDGVPYVAQWYSQGDDPLGASTRDSPSPWRSLTAVELREAKDAADGD